MTSYSHLATFLTRLVTHPQKCCPQFILLAVSVFSFQSCTTEKTEDYSEIKEEASVVADAYVGDQNCVSCHEEAAQDWEGSHHDKAMQEVNEESVLGDFDNQSIVIDGVSYFFYKQDNEFRVRIREIDGSENEY